MNIKPATELNPKSKILKYANLLADHFYKVAGVAGIDYCGAIVLALQPDYKTEKLSRLILLIIQHNSSDYRKVIGQSYAVGLTFQHIDIDTPFNLTIG